MSDIERLAEKLWEVVYYNGAVSDVEKELEEWQEARAQQAGSGEAVAPSIKYFDEVISPVIMAYVNHSDELLVRRIWDDVRRAILAAHPQPAQQADALGTVEGGQ